MKIISPKAKLLLGFLTLFIALEIIALINLKNRDDTRIEGKIKLPNSESELIILAQDYYKEGDYEEAIAAYQKMLNLTTDKENAYLQLANVYRYWGKYEESEVMFKKALELNPQNDSTYTDLGKLYRNMHRFDDAEKSLKKALGK